MEVGSVERPLILQHQPQALSLVCEIVFLWHFSGFVQISSIENHQETSFYPVTVSQYASLL